MLNPRINFGWDSSSSSLEEEDASQLVNTSTIFFPEIHHDNNREKS